MKHASSLAVILCSVTLSFPASALPLQPSVAGTAAFQAAAILPVSSWGERASGPSHRYRHRIAPAAPIDEGAADAPSGSYGPYGGFVVNRYGSGNYVGGPGGFGGYPAGSGPDFIYRQQETWKCEYAPESCF